MNELTMIEVARRESLDRQRRLTTRLPYPGRAQAQRAGQLVDRRRGRMD